MPPTQTVHPRSRGRHYRCRQNSSCYPLDDNLSRGTQFIVSYITAVATATSALVSKLAGPILPNGAAPIPTGIFQYTVVPPAASITALHFSQTNQTAWSRDPKPYLGGASARIGDLTIMTGMLCLGLVMAVAASSFPLNSLRHRSLHCEVCIRLSRCHRFSQCHIYIMDNLGNRLHYAWMLACRKTQ